jgi:hypothetical protein
VFIRFEILREVRIGIAVACPVDIFRVELLLDQCFSTRVTCTTGGTRSLGITVFVILFKYVNRITKLFKYSYTKITLKMYL